MVLGSGRWWEARDVVSGRVVVVLGGTRAETKVE